MQKHTAALKKRKESENKDDGKMEKTTTRPTEHKQKKRDEAADAVIRVGCVSLKIKHQAKKGNAQRVFVYLWAKNEIRWDETQESILTHQLKMLVLRGGCGSGGVAGHLLIY